MPDSPFIQLTGFTEFSGKSSRLKPGHGLFTTIKNARICFLIFLMIIFHQCIQAQSSLDAGKLMGLFQNQQYEEAVSYLTPLETREPANLQLLGYLAYAHRMNDNYTIAGNYYNKMLALDSNNVAALQYISADDNTAFDKAMVLSRRLADLQPNKPSYHKNLADLFRKENEKDSALLYYKNAYNLAPNDHRYVAAYADILLDQQQTPTADSLLEAGLLRDSLNISYLTLRIRSAYEARDYERVLAPGERLIRTGEKTLNPFLKLALAYYNLKKYNDCIRVCDYLLNQGFEVESVYYYQAKSWAKLMDFAKSNELLERCLTIAISETAEMYYYNLAENNEATRQYKKAVAYYDSAYYLFKNPVMMYNSGRIMESALNNEKLAFTYYTRYLQKASPRSAEEKKVYQYVRSRIPKKKNAGGK